MELRSSVPTRVRLGASGAALNMEVSRQDRTFFARSLHARQVIRDLGLSDLGVRLLFAIAANEGRTLSFYAEALEITQAVASRGSYDLTEKERRDGALELVERRVDATDNRRKGYYLTAKGHKVVQRIVGIYKGDEDDKLPVPPQRAA